MEGGNEQLRRRRRQGHDKSGEEWKTATKKTATVHAKLGVAEVTRSAYTVGLDTSGEELKDATNNMVRAKTGPGCTPEPNVGS